MKYKTPIFFILLAFNMGCQEAKNNSYPNIDQNAIYNNPALNIVLGERTATSCLSDPAVDACIFWKNPVAQSQEPLPEDEDSLLLTLQDLQIYGVSISDTLGYVQVNAPLVNHSNVPPPHSSIANTIKKFQQQQNSNVLVELKPQNIFSFNQKRGFSLRNIFSNDLNRFADHTSELLRNANSLKNTMPTNRMPLNDPLRWNQETGVLLQNNNYRVVIDVPGVERLRPQADGSWKFRYGDEGHSIAQLMTYHYLMYQMNWMQNNAGGWYASNKSIVAVAVEEGLKNNAYWSSAENKLALGIVCEEGFLNSCNKRFEMALNAESILHEAGHANFNYANKKLTSGGYCENHTNCKGSSICDVDPSSSPICCTNETGCFRAIEEGIADFHSALIFPDAPQIGESIANNLEGLRCEANSGVYRNPQVNLQVTATDVFNECHNKSYGIGILYSSIWWAIYTHPEVIPFEIAKLFTDHLPLITLDDTLTTIVQKILNLDRNLYQGKHANIIESEFTKRGLSVIAGG